jgi:signal transduction histidine kinase
MESLVNQMLASVQILQSAVHVRPEGLDLGAVVDEVIGQLEPDAKRAGVAVSRVGAREVRGRWDRVLVEHIVANLLRNAIRFGMGRPVTVECADLGERVCLSVSDHGIGIAQEDQERIFKRYGRAVPSRYYGGLGLGLWATREMLSRMGGTIVVRSAPGQGATFQVELPTRP